jgi:hypothetical protein
MLSTTKRVGEDYVTPLPDYAKVVPPLPPVRSIDPNSYVGACKELLKRR